MVSVINKHTPPIKEKVCWYQRNNTVDGFTGHGFFTPVGALKMEEFLIKV
jgi:hypothetical protein